MSTRNHNERCKNCGYCPACGRSDRYWGGPYWYPSWYPNGVTIWNGVQTTGAAANPYPITYTQIGSAGTATYTLT